ncbi:hypothetical protein [Geodermatophilus sp. URMC 64]
MSAVTVERSGPEKDHPSPHTSHARRGALKDGRDADDEAAVAVAAQLAAFPQTCLRQDRTSLLEQEGLDEAAALANEFRHGRASLAVDALPGAARFAAGAGRHGRGVS